MKKFILLLALVASNAFAWEPTKPIDVIVGWSPGSGNDVSFRIVSAQVEKNTSARFVIRYRPGAGGAIADSELVRYQPDGNTLVVASAPSLTATDRIAVPSKTWDIESFTNVMGYASSPLVVFTSPDDPVNSIKDFAKVLKTEKVAFGDPGGASRLTYEMLKANIGFKENDSGIVHVTYKGNPETIAAVMSKEIRFGVSPIATVIEQYKAGKVKIIGLTSPKQLPAFPNIPTFSSVYPNVTYQLVWGITMPKGVPDDVVKWYEVAFKEALNSDVVKEQLHNNIMSVSTHTLTRKEYTDYLIKERTTLEPLVNHILSEAK